VSRTVHEWSLAEAVIRYVKGVVGERSGSRARLVVLKLGRLQSIDREVFEFALRELSRSEGVEIGELRMIEEDPVLRCRRCGYTWTVDMSRVSEDVAEAIHFVPEVVHSFFKCPRCGSRDFEVVKGRGVYVERVEVE